MIDKKVIEKIVNIISENYSPEKILLFGSYSNGTANEDSDLDLFIVKESTESRINRALEIKKIFRKNKITLPVDLLVYTPNEIASENYGSNSFVHQVINNGILVYERQ